MKPSARNHPSSHTVHQDTVVITCVKGISEKLKNIGNLSNLRTIFKNKHALRGKLMNTVPVRDAQ
jgi:hypothetical protein